MIKYRMFKKIELIKHKKLCETCDYFESEGEYSYDGFCNFNYGLKKCNDTYNEIKCKYTKLCVIYCPEVKGYNYCEDKWKLGGNDDEEGESEIN